MTRSIGHGIQEAEQALLAELRRVRRTVRAKPGEAGGTAPRLTTGQKIAGAAETDCQINIKAELEIELLHQKLDQRCETEVLQLTTVVRNQTELLNRSGPCAPPASKPGAGSA